MKNLINKKIKYFEKNYKYIILLLLIILLFVINIKTKNALNVLNKKINGTYMMGEEITGDAEYFVLTDSKYYRYKQFENIEEGEYEKVKQNLYVLKNGLKEYIVHNSNEIYYFNIKQNEIFIYSKIDDNCIFINYSPGK